MWKGQTFRREKNNREYGCTQRYITTVIVGRQGRMDMIICTFLVKHKERLSADHKGMCWKFEEKDDAKRSPLESKKNKFIKEIYSRTARQHHVPIWNLRSFKLRKIRLVIQFSLIMLNCLCMKHCFQ